MRFKNFTEYLEKIEKTTKRLEMFDILSELFQKADKKEINKIVYFCEEQLLPPATGVELNMAGKMAEKAIAKSSNRNKEEIFKEYERLGDYGLVAEKLIKKAIKKELSVTEIYDQLMKIAKTSGEGSVEKKVEILSNVLNHCSPKEAKYITRFVLGRLRLGIGDPTIMDSLSKALTGDRRKLRPKIENAYNLSSDLGRVAAQLFQKGIKGLEKRKQVKGFGIKIGQPIRMALASRLPEAIDIVKKIGRCAIESKYDGFRLQCHKDGDKVEIFSRNLEKMTHMFPDIVKGIREQIKSKKVIVEGEALTYDESTGDLLPFQVTIQRKRKHHVIEMAKELPLKIFLFDILARDNEDLMRLPYEERHKILKNEIKSGNVVKLANRIITDDPKEVEKFFEDALGKGLEGIIAKKLDAPYEAGGRKFSWIKLKKSYKSKLTDTVDVVIIGYFHGKGMRTKFGIGALLAAVYDKKKDAFTTIARVGSGLSEKNWVKIRELIDKDKVSHKPARVESLITPDFWVTPKYVFEVNADEITQSQMHTTGKHGDKPGFALRFPRILNWIRVDKKPEDATSTKEIESMFKQQRATKKK